ncbi:hypothetical protein ACFZCY_42220 [Streptomyces sp. NPDC007983]|uniref:hypothetical protein n=1 Tax=Streptomyces sp. NPDC007983 TaxID=3364800 RepID=UPI0036F0517D
MTPPIGHASEHGATATSGPVMVVNAGFTTAVTPRRVLGVPPRPTGADPLAVHRLLPTILGAPIAAVAAQLAGALPAIGVQPPGSSR